MGERRLRLGVAGLGRGFMLTLPTLRADPRLAVVAGADPLPEARQRFAADFGAKVYADVAALCQDAAVEAVYIATPHQFHAEHALAAAAAGKHLLIEKPMALDLAQCRAMVDAAKAAGVQLLVGPSHSYDAPIRETRRLIASGAYGRLRLVTALNFTDFLYRPRRPEELDTAQGGGVILSQGAHQIDILRLLGGGMVRSIRAAAGQWDPARPTEGAYAAFLDFVGGAAATITYSGYAHFDSDELCGWIGETGAAKDPERYGEARRALAAAPDAAAEAALKSRRGYGTAPDAPPARFHEHFGFFIASCEHADLRPLPQGVMVYGHAERRLHPLPAPAAARSAVIDELYAAVVEGRVPVHSGEWGLATLEVCLALLRSAEDGREVKLAAQVPVPDGA